MCEDDAEYSFYSVSPEELAPIGAGLALLFFYMRLLIFVLFFLTCAHMIPLTVLSSIEYNKNIVLYSN